MRKFLALLFMFMLVGQSWARTGTQLVSDFRFKTSELSNTATVQLADSTILRWVNDGQAAVSRMMEPLKLDTGFKSTAKFMDVTMPTNIQDVFSIRLNGKGSVIEVPPGIFGVIDTGQGSWYSFGRTLNLDLQDNTTTSDSVIVEYYARPADLILADTCLIDDNIQPLILDWAYGEYELSRHRVNNALAIRQSVIQQLQTIRTGRVASKQTE